jgi:hypothetical protein
MTRGPGEYHQADLIGRWRVHVLLYASDPDWFKLATITPPPRERPNCRHAGWACVHRGLRLSS